MLTNRGRRLLRDLGSLAVRALGRVELVGAENLPAPGSRMVIVANRASLRDARLMRRLLPPDTVFAIDSDRAGKWWVRPFLWGLRYQAVDPARPLALRRLASAVKAGRPLVILSHGRGAAAREPVQHEEGAALIADRTGALVVPVRIEGARRATLGHLARGQLGKALLSRATLTIETPVRLPADGHGKQRRRTAVAALQDVLAGMAVRTMVGERTLIAALRDTTATRGTRGPVVLDASGARLGYRELIRAAQVLAPRLEPLAAEGRSVGVMLPNSAASVVVFFALQSIARVPAMLNFTAGAESLASCCRAAELQTILTSRAFVGKARLDALVTQLGREARIVYLEDISGRITLADKLRGVLQGSRERIARQPDDPAVILFTSGSEGAPKGVVLSHRNILANAAQALSRVEVNGADKVFNVLPVFHSFGLTAGLIMPLMAGVPVFLYPSPLHYRAVPELVHQSRATILFGTNTFLAGYARAAHVDAFRSLRLVVAGAEPVQPQTRGLYLERFGVRILEGYGVTEAAPVVALNTPLANRAGTVGRLSPLMQARLVPVEGVTEGARLLVRGPNVMLGYLRAGNPGVLVPPPGGWHDTGDIVAIDGDGYITIKGRVGRFAKIAGEMVSLAAVEALAQALWPDAASVAVAVPDQRRGERLVLVTTAPDASREPLLRQARSAGVSELHMPAEIVTVDALPVLGSGKPDHLAIRALAEGGRGQRMPRAS